MTRTTKALASAVLALLLTGSGALAGGGHKELGTDPAGDGIPALDITYLHVGKEGKDLNILIGVDGMLPVIGGYPELPGIEWIFEVKGRKFVAEAAIVEGEPAFFLFEEKDGAFQQLDAPTGTYDHADGFISIRVPLKTIGAKKGSVISGAGENDVDAHVHLGVQTYYPDTMTTEKDFVVP